LDAVKPDTSPTARALLALELVQGSPGITADRLADKLGISERAARRYVGILREAGIPIESVRGRYGGYRVGRGLRVPPLMFSAAEALGLVMAVLDGHHQASDPTDPVGSALGKIVRALPESVAAQAEAVRQTTAPAPDRAAARPDPGTTSALVQACSSHRRVRFGYRSEAGSEWVTEVDPWAVVVRHGRWYLLCSSGTSNSAKLASRTSSDAATLASRTSSDAAKLASRTSSDAAKLASRTSGDAATLASRTSGDTRRAYRIDRVRGVAVLDDTFSPPADFDPVAMLEEHLAVGWEYEVEVVIDAPFDTVARCLPRAVGRIEPLEADTCRLVGSTSNPVWYAEQLVAIPAPYRIVKCPELREAARVLGQRLLTAGETRSGLLSVGRATVAEHRSPR
jgi:predicted DNA-binding transcriptional regulator YafY